ncbi:Methylated-DNA-[protein]-cysteine S-methyltransferase, DNA binding protein [Cordyceps fumosorosea ARSEF 2679]|uniref:Methylated-DNA-[protein]-cysteine S-methyltransferase, DNA binding protein n=1 Tax=Cordyceps fumosorosea (strain ARSEF 2679) TaxID=1081104 RepID=A0A168BBS3_CORFA|nr:Methylated-DNA-[protein]-cysteine S-methyltransferase, DNA binding protein [Cordyceps fumosorosea ARSEF 2679]OAA69901.1 Methylated-DNA-[protein]-cysteine S-methyltransferase, DNA binding protein [Cordyceps fumosorosea ARSEF 2679]
MRRRLAHSRQLRQPLPASTNLSTTTKSHSSHHNPTPASPTSTYPPNAPHGRGRRLFPRRLLRRQRDPPRPGNLLRPHRPPHRHPSVPPLSLLPFPSHFPNLLPAQRPRQVGVCLKHLPAAEEGHRWDHDSVPWQRVVNARGVISPRAHPTAVRDQAELLRDEGVEVVRGALGEMSVDLAEYGWFPEALPSEHEAGAKEEEHVEIKEEDSEDD